MYDSIWGGGVVLFKKLGLMVVVYQFVFQSSGLNNWILVIPLKEPEYQDFRIYRTSPTYNGEMCQQSLSSPWSNRLFWTPLSNTLS